MFVLMSHHIKGQRKPKNVTVWYTTRPTVQLMYVHATLNRFLCIRRVWSRRHGELCVQEMRSKRTKNEYQLWRELFVQHQLFISLVRCVSPSYFLYNSPNMSELLRICML